jgi:hypothetical protein
MMNIQSILKTLSVSFICTFAGFLSSAQTAQTEMEIIQEAFGLDKKVAVANFMQLGEEAAIFWNIYDEYEAERKILGKQRIDVIAQYIKNYPSITDEEILELYKSTNSIKKSFAKLQSNYFKKMNKALGAKKAAQFWQLENYFNSMIQANIYTQLPFIGEQDRN